MKSHDLERKYNIPVPRYTSYPAVPHWNGAPCEGIWLGHLKDHYDPAQGVELYIHVPFCEKLCYYCGCHRVISKNKDRGLEYVNYLIKEWKLYKKKLGDIKIASIHLGGGTPNFLTVEAFTNLFNELSPSFKEEEFKGSIEIDPRTCTKEQLDMYKSFGIERLSMGVQDFDEKVQLAIGRVQPYEKVKELVDYAREIGIADINFDLIYGLPFQSTNTITETIEKVLTLNPLQIAFYSYAHLPSRIKNQRLIPEEGLLHGMEKRALYEKGKELLAINHYEEIGLDHFAKDDSSLAKAKKEGRLRRNFMGHTHKTSSMIIGLGCSSISSSIKSFAQNEKEVKEYYNKINSGLLAIRSGHTQSSQDLEVEEIMQDFFATNSIDKKSWKKLNHASIIKQKLDELQEDGLIEEGDRFLVTEKGRPFMRNIASIFDHHLLESKQNSGSTSL
ncbi:oxygen-independent coproporphyrinogen III oxidase [Halobacteriovorax vibrionivorans]|uniref:Coproporphyrinogen-III oxidase n=1 Tax=Halobacteriovorax vibrionivorans TaxID=2152716 RepID=A0ABY0IGC8_9BACT|nr:MULTISPECIES: oxygen-independent coproporphyrinogen III oxidase [Halobacteriovorax]RZF21545.1 oxygen-independent coproporphyrinogen III oxidase [Halobacteriovorax vibrionivorans]TGD49162.1 oxygen-independent coproporphyrinogen III oxidase [Halobacteriovorax sp. Y22]